MKGHRRKVLLGCSVLASLLLLFICVEHYRGKWAWIALEKELRAKGEKLTVEELMPPRPLPEQNAASLVLQLADKVKNWPSWLYLPPAMMTVAPGRAQVGFRQTEWKSYPQGTNQNWSVLSNLLTECHDELSAVRRGLIERPGLDFGLRHLGGLDMFTYREQWPAAKATASWLRATELSDLRNNNLNGALENLKAIAHLAIRVKEEHDDISTVIAVSAASNGLHGTWDALQVSGWTDAQLHQLQLMWEKGGYVESQARAFEMNRNELLRTMKDLERREPAALEYYRALWERAMRGSGDKPPGPVANYIFLSIWKTLWADQAKCLIVQAYQPSIELAHRVALRRSWAAGKTQFETLFHTPPRWIFHDVLVASFVVPGNYISVQSVRSDWIRTAVRLETFRELTVAAIALKRYHLVHQRYPDDLQALVPVYLHNLPVDYMVGRPLRYRLNTDGSFMLYSVGEDGNDDAGDPTPAPPNEKSCDMFLGRDIVWPQPATPAEIRAYKIKRGY